MQEIWVEINDFPIYAISNLGRIINTEKGYPIRQSFNSSGIMRVGLVRDGVQYTRSVKVLVAEHFVKGYTGIFDTPIQLDGDPRNCRSDNLVYRPRWFAWKHTVQFRNISPAHYRGPVMDADTGDVYEHVVHAAMVNGLLFKDIWRSIHYGEPTFPTKQVFKIQRFD